MEAIREKLIEATAKFIEYAGYRREESKDIGFIRPDLEASKTLPNLDHRIYVTARVGIEEALDGFGDLVALKYYMGKKHDYALVLPPISEYAMMEFLLNEEDWYYKIKKEAFMIWVCNPEWGTVSCIIGWPLNDGLKDFFSNPAVANFDHYISQLAAKKMMEEEEEEFE